MKKQLVIIIGLVILVLILGLIFIMRKPKTTIAPTTSNTTTVVNTGPVDCAGDASCLSTNLLSCQPAEFKMDFTTPGSKYIITVYGKEDDNCHYDFKVLNADGSLMAGSDCQVPLASI